MSFVTGSYAYGTPSEKSDIDLVVLMSADDMEALCGLEDSEEDSRSDGAESVSLRFGKLNLIVCTNERDYITWRKGTDQLIARKPVKREEAVELFDKLRAEAAKAEADAEAAEFEKTLPDEERTVAGAEELLCGLAKQPGEHAD